MAGRAGARGGFGKIIPSQRRRLGDWAIELLGLNLAGIEFGDLRRAPSQSNRTIQSTQFNRPIAQSLRSRATLAGDSRGSEKITAVLFVPEGLRKLAGGEASPRAQPPEPGSKCKPPRRGAGNKHASDFQRPSGAGSLFAASPVVALADSLHHRQISAAPPARSARQVVESIHPLSKKIRAVS